MLKLKLKPKIAFMGFGEHAIRSHYKYLTAMDCTLVGFFDPGVTLEALAADHGITGLKKYSTEEELLADDITAVIIGSPDEYHLNQLEKAIDARKHIFCEKPMFVEHRDTQRFVTALAYAESKKLVVTTCHPRRFDPPVVWLKENLERISLEIGGINAFRFSFSYHEVTDPWKKDRSLLSDHFSHEIDLLAYLFGDHSFEAQTLKDAHDAYHVVGQTKEGLAFDFDGKRDQTESVYHEWIELCGTKKRMILSLNTGEVSYSDGKQEKKAQENPNPPTPKTDVGMFIEEKPQKPSLPKPKSYTAMFEAVNKNFIDALQGEDRPYLTAKDLRRNNISAAELKDKKATIWVSTLF